MIKRLNTAGEWGFIAMSWALVAGVLLLNLSWTVRNSYSRDENMFVAGAGLMSNSSMAPYRDFQFLHPPNQILVDSLLFRFTDHYLFAGRIFSAVCAAGIAALVLWIAKGFWNDRSKVVRYAVAWLSVFFLIANPLYVFVSGYLWDYNLAGLFAILAFCLFLKGKRTSRTGIWLLASGLAFGLAIGTRLNYITGLVPFWGLLMLYPAGNSIRGYLRWMASFNLGLGIGLLPTIYYALMAPKAFWFGNVTYHRLNTVFRAGGVFEGAIDLGERLSYFWNQVIAQPGNLLLFLALIFFGYLILSPQVRQNRKLDFTSIALLWLVPFIGVGAFLASPVWYQYFYAPVPFAVCAAAYGLKRATLLPDQPARRLGALFVLLVLLTNLYQLQEYRRVTFLLHPESWRPLQFHQLGQQIRAAVGAGKVLTLAPELVMEAGLEIYPELATGPFIWRVASLVPEEERQALDLVAPEDLESFLAQEPPAGILVGIESYYETALLDYASQHGYHKIELTQDIAIWLPGSPAP